MPSAVDPSSAVVNCAPGEQGCSLSGCRRWAARSGHHVVSGPSAGDDRIAAESHITEAWRDGRALGDLVQGGFRSPSGAALVDSNLSLMSAAIPAQMGADCDVPPPVRTCWRKTIFTPVNGSPTAATSGTSRRSWGPAAASTVCHGGLSYSDDAPPAVPPASAVRHTRDCSASQLPSESVDIRVAAHRRHHPASMPPSVHSDVVRTRRIDQFSPLHSRPPDPSEASNAVVP